MENNIEKFIQDFYCIEPEHAHPKAPIGEDYKGIIKLLTEFKEHMEDEKDSPKADVLREALRLIQQTIDDNQTYRLKQAWNIVSDFITQAESKEDNKAFGEQDELWEEAEELCQGEVTKSLIAQGATKVRIHHVIDVLKEHFHITRKTRIEKQTI